MKRKIIPILCMLLFFLPVMAFAVETLSTVYVDGSAPMTIDGILDDWEQIPIESVQVINQIADTPKNIRGVIQTSGAADISYSFKCFADNRYVYFALMVTDDDVIIGNQVFGEGWKDDSTTIYFDGDCQNIEKPYFDENDGNLKVIGAPPDGVSWIEGLIPYFKIQVPYFWESRGVKAGFQQIDSGYNIEIAIPLVVLGWDSISPDKTMGMNTRVVDMDTSIDKETTDKGLIWNEDPDHSAHYMTKNYGRIVFEKAVNISGISQQVTKPVSSEARELEIVLGAPSYTDGEAFFDEVLADISNSDFTAAETKLISEKEKIWVQPILSVIQLKQDKIDEGVQQLFTFGENCPDAFAEAWVKTFLKNEVRWVYEVFKGESIEFEQLSKNNLNLILEKYTKKYPYDGEGWLIVGKFAESTGNFELAISNYNNAVLFNDGDDTDFIRMNIARNHFFLGNYIEASDITNDILLTSKVSKTILDAKLLLYS
ncbi:sugar-binding protein, partial [Candidatus Latescibacterota bacterium]